MPYLCDICGKAIVPGEPMRGGHGDGGVTGPIMTKRRHWACHVIEYGEPSSASFAVARTLTMGPPPKAVLPPKVRKGPYNRSTNAAREFVVLERMREMGKTRVRIECPFCFARFWAFVWSISGGGKKCPNCGAMHGSTGDAYPVAGNEDLGEGQPLG